jgi:ERCC4-type nuclease
MEIPRQIRIEVDERETQLYEHILSTKNARDNTNQIHIVKKVLPLGDILIYLDVETNPIVVLERKTFQDLFASIKDGRYKEQSYRLIHSNLISNVHNIIYLIEGAVSQLRSSKEQALLYSTVTSLNLYKGFSIYRTTHIQESAEYIYEMATKIIRNAIQRKEFPLYMTKPTLPEVTLDTIATETNEIVEPYSSVVKINKKENITPENIGTIMLCQIPGINYITAEQIMKEYGTIAGLVTRLEIDHNCLDNFYTTTSSGTKRKLGKNIIENIWKFLL